MNIQMLAACVKMRESWYEFSKWSKREDKDFDLIKHITAEKNKVKPEEVTKEVRHETKASLFTTMYFESYYNEDKIDPAVYSIVDDVLVGMYNLIKDKESDISFGKLLETSGDIHRLLFEGDLYEDRDYYTVCEYFEVRDMRKFMYTVASQDCVAFSNFVRKFWELSTKIRCGIHY